MGYTLPRCVTAVFIRAFIYLRNSTFVCVFFLDELLKMLFYFLVLGERIGDVDEIIVVLSLLYKIMLVCLEDLLISTVPFSNPNINICD